MNHSLRNGLCVTAALAAVLAIGLQQRGAKPATPATPATPAAPPNNQFALVSAQRFHVAKPYQHLYRADRPFVDHGWLLVLECDATLLVRRQVAEPVLIVGNQTAERINVGDKSGRLVVLVPGDVDLDKAPIFLGSAQLPEEMRQKEIDAELAATTATPPTAKEIQMVLVAGVQNCADDYELRLRAIDLVERYSPDEQDLIRGARVPLVK